MLNSIEVKLNFHNWNALFSSSNRRNTVKIPSASSVTFYSAYCTEHYLAYLQMSMASTNIPG